MTHRLAACAVLLGLVAPAIAQNNKAAAVAAYDEGKRLMGEGKIAEACPKFQASYEADPQLGTLLNLADCHEKLGLLASAWAEYSEVAETAHKRGDNRETYAQGRADALEPRLSRLTIHRPDVAIAGLIVRNDGVDVTKLLDTALPIDPGTHQLSAEAPGRDAWSTTVVMDGEAQTEEVSIPALAETKLDVRAPDKDVPRTVVDASRRTNRRILAIASAGVGLVSAGIGLYFGKRAFDDWDASRDPALCDTDNVCTTEGQQLVDSAGSAALKADIFVGIGLAGIAAAAILWFTAPDVETRVQGGDEVSVAAVLTGDFVGGVLQRRF